jgi:hypothetical protein
VSAIPKPIRMGAAPWTGAGELPASPIATTVTPTITQTKLERLCRAIDLSSIPPVPA